MSSLLEKNLEKEMGPLEEVATEREREVTNLLSRYMSRDITLEELVDNLSEEELYANQHYFPSIIDSKTFIRDFHTDTWLIKDYIPSSELSEMFGASGSRKTFIALDMATCVHNGLDWHGIPVTQGEVLYVCGEGVNGVRKRLSAFERHYNVETTMDILPTSIDMMDERGMKELAMIIRLLKKEYAWIIIDTLNANFSGAENSADDFAIMKKNLKSTIVTEDTNRMVTWIHHTGKMGGDTSRGTSARYAGVDMSLQVEKQDKYSSIRCRKMKEADEFEALTFSFKAVETEFVDDELKPMYSLVPILEEDRKAVASFKPPAYHEDIVRGIRLAYKDGKAVLPTETFEKRFDLVPGENRVVSVETAKEYAYKEFENSNKTSAFNRWLEKAKTVSICYFYDDFILLTADAKISKVSKTQ